MAIKASSSSPMQGGSTAQTPIRLEYYGEGQKLLWSKQWQASPFRKGTVLDWQTGTLRSPLYDADDEQQETVAPQEPFKWPQWHTTIVPDRGGEFTETEGDGYNSEILDKLDCYISVEGGYLVRLKGTYPAVGNSDSDAEDAPTPSRLFTVAATPIPGKTLPDKITSPGTVYLVGMEHESSEDEPDRENDIELNIQFFEKQGKPTNAILAVPLACINEVADEDAPIQWESVQLESSTIYIAEEGAPLTIDANSKALILPGEDGSATTYELVIKGGISSPPTIGIFERTGGGGGGGDDPGSRDDPPCGHPANRPGAGTGSGDDNDLTHPFEPDDRHPGNDEGDNGITPNSSGECP